jgi:hypothetical protein
LALIDKWLNDDKDQPKKQRHTAVRIFHRLQQEISFEGSETTVRRYVREAKLRLGLSGQQAFIPCQPTLGGEAEVDWGTCYAILDGESVRLKLFCMRSKYSGKHFVQCYPCERQQSFSMPIFVHSRFSTGYFLAHLRQSYNGGAKSIFGQKT